MPLYEGLVLGSDKYCAVFEFGTSYTKCGFAYEYTPRVFIKSQIFVKSLDKVVNIMDLKDEKHLYEALKSFIELMYFRYLAINPKDRKVIICESLFSYKLFRDTLIKVFFEHFDVPALLIVPQNLMALMTLKISTGLVIDLGYKEAICVPVINGVTVLESTNFANLGSKQLNERIKENLINFKSEVKLVDGVRNVIDEDLNDKLIEDIKLKACFVCPFDRIIDLKNKYIDKLDSLCKDIENCPKDLNYPILGDRILTIPGIVREISCEIFFEQNGEEQNLVKLIIDTLLNCPKDFRKTLSSNLILIGGTSMIPGFKHRLHKELLNAVNKLDCYKEKFFIKEFKFHQTPCKENYVCWLGASIFGWTDAMNLRAITKDQYFKSGIKLIQDWSDWWPTKKYKSLDLYTGLNKRSEIELSYSK